jgi:MoxR-like ATPase
MVKQSDSVKGEVGKSVVEHKKADDTNKNKDDAKKDNKDTKKTHASSDRSDTKDSSVSAASASKDDSSKAEDKTTKAQEKKEGKVVVVPHDFKSTADIKISPATINQVIGQESAVEVIKKAANQRRHVLLIGEPGTGKSMLGLALAELLPKEKLVDIVSFSNPNDENQPLIRT